MICRRTTIQLLALMVLLSITDCKPKKVKNPTDQLLASLEKTISVMTDLVANQKQRIQELTISLGKCEPMSRTGNVSIEDLQSGFSQQIEELATKSTQERDALSQRIHELTNQFIKEKEELNTTFSQKIEDLATKCTKEKDALNASLSQGIRELTTRKEALNFTFSEELEDLATKHAKQIEKLSSGLSQQIESLDDKLDGSKSNTTLKLEELKKEVTRTKKIIIENVEDMATNITLATSGVENLAAKFADVKSVVGAWPKGSYCILGSGGSCPTGFTRFHGSVRAIRTYSPTERYLKSANFGDSSVSCHNACGQYSPHNADLHIVSCCK